jgi:hypothetical protein
MQGPWHWEISSKWKWLALALIIKAAIFCYFAWEFNRNWEAKNIQSGIVVFYQDSYTYYTPVEECVDGKGYRGACRMPGFLPIYGPVYALFGAEYGRVIMIVLQIMFDAIATYALAMIAYRMRAKRAVFYTAFALASISTFVSVWNNYAVSDSFAVATLIFAFYALQQYTIDRKNKTLFIAGLWLCWSIFFRPIHMIAAPCMGLYLLAFWHPAWKAWWLNTRRTLLFASALIVPLPTTDFTLPQSPADARARSCAAKLREWEEWKTGRLVNPAQA